MTFVARTGRVRAATRGRVLVVDDDHEMVAFVSDVLSRQGWQVQGVTSGEEALRALAGEPVEALVTDLNMRGLSGVELCERVVANHPDVPVVVITAFGSLDTAIAAIRAGAYDFIPKPFEAEVLDLALERAVQHRRLREEVNRLRRAVAESTTFGALLGSSQVMRGLFGLLANVARSEAAVLIRGETGTGKELVARALHDQGPRAKGPFLAVHCASMTEPLLDAELFGPAGLLVRSARGTLFLDGVSDLPAPLQARLVRALQERAVRPAGTTDELAFDSRVIAATHRDIETAVEEGRFRQDLYFRLNVIGIDVPPLRARGSDVLLLAQHFLERCAARADKRVAGITAPCADRLLAYSWPGNVRELQNCIERAVALTERDKLVVDDLPDQVRTYRASHVLVAGDDPSELVPMEEVERRYVLRVLDAVRGNKSSAARVLGFDRKTLYRKLQRYGVDTGGPDAGEP